LRNVDILNIIIDKSNNEQELLNFNSTKNKFSERRIILKKDNVDTENDFKEVSKSNFTNALKPVLLKVNKNNKDNKEKDESNSNNVIIKDNKFEIKSINNKELNNNNNNSITNKKHKKNSSKLAINDKVSKMHFSYFELLIMLISKVLCGFYLIKNQDFRSRCEAYKKNYDIIIKSLDIKNIIKSGSIFEALDDDQIQFCEFNEKSIE
jgi:hypothetical protein